MDVLLLTAAAVHLGFQLAVTALVYPTLGRGGAEGFAARHAAHVRAITPLVLPVYGVLLLAAGRAATEGRWATGAVVLALLAVTGLRAAPLHGRLERAWDERRWRALVAADRVRLALAVAVLVAALPW